MRKFLNVLIKTVLFFFGWAVLVGVLPTIPSKISAVWRFGAELIPLLIIIVFTVIFWSIDRKEIHIPFFKRPVFNICLGIGIGCVWLGLTVIVLFLTGTIKIQGINNVPYLWLWIISSFLNVIMQELLVRGYLYQLLKTKYNVIIAIIFTTALFTFMHGGAFEAGIIPVLNIVTMSLFMSAILEYTGSLLAPIVIHFIWNTVGAIILGGVSLADDYPCLLNTVFSGNKLLSGGTCKIEGSIIVLVLNITLFILFVKLIKKKITQPHGCDVNKVR